MSAKTVFEDLFPEEVWQQTYKDHNDVTVDDSLRRIAKAISSVEETEELRVEWENKFFDMMTGFKVVPAGRILSNAGTEWQGTTLMNCFVGPRVKHDADSIEGIYAHLLSQSQTLKSEGGWGENFSYIRPRGAFIDGIGVETPGAVKYMELFDKASEIITSGSGRKSANKKAKGKIRKGAMMAVMDITHPDIIEFVTAKQQPGRLTKFNTSVNVTDDFMNRVIKIRNLEATPIGTSEENAAQIAELDTWELIFPDTKHPAHKKDWAGDINAWKAKGYPVIVHNTVSVKWLWDMIMQSTYNRAEPGILFLDRANDLNELNYMETIFATNPCGEQTLAPGGVCNLITQNLTQFVNKDYTDFDYRKIDKHARLMVRFADNVNSYSSAPLKEYVDSMREKRRIGCGVMGWGSALLMLKVPFGSERAGQLRDRLMKVFSHAIVEASVDLAEEKGHFKHCIPEKHAEAKFFKQIGVKSEVLDKMRQVGIRNSSLISCQPNGSSSIFANVVSGGIEPIFMHEYVRTVIVPTMPEELADVCPRWFEGEWRETKMFKFAKEGDEEILKGKHNGIVYKIDKNRGLTKEVLCEDYGVRNLKSRGEWNVKADYAVGALQLTTSQHVDDLEGFAKYVDSAISKTINLPNEYPIDDFKKLYIHGFETGYIKGLTTYRSGTMTTVLSEKETTETGACAEEIILDEVNIPDSAPATMKVLKAEGRKWYLTVVWNEQHNRPFAMFVHTNSYEKTVTAADAVDHLLELAKRKGIKQEHIEQIMDKIKGDDNASKVARMVSLNLRHGVLIKNIVATLDRVEAPLGSFVFHVKKYLSGFIKDGEAVEGSKCDNCGSGQVVFQEGCQKCVSCGSSKCG